MSKVRRLPIIPLAEPIQLVLGLAIGIRRPRRKKAAQWLTPPEKRAA